MQVLRALVVSALVVPMYCKRSTPEEHEAQDQEYISNLTNWLPLSFVETPKTEAVTTEDSAVGQIEEQTKKILAQPCQDKPDCDSVPSHDKNSINTTIGGMNNVFAKVQDEKMKEAQTEATGAIASGDVDGLVLAAHKMKEARNMKKLLVREQQVMEESKTQREGEREAQREAKREGTRKKGSSNNFIVDGDDKDDLKGPSVTALCIVSLISQYFVIHTALAIARAIFQSSSSDIKGAFLSILEAATPSLSFVPMLCVLFYAVRLRVVYLAQGVPEKYGLPYWWVHWGEIGASLGVFVQLCFVILFAAVMGAPPAQDSLQEHKPVHVEGGNVCCSVFLMVLQYFGTIATYFGAGLCCAGVMIMKAPEEVWHKDGEPVISVALLCVLMLTVLYFIIYFALQCVRTANQMRGDGHSKAQDVLELAGFVLRFVPMLCILFMCVRIKATQIRSDYKEPRWVNWPMFGCAGGILLQTILTIAVPSCCEGKAKKGASEADISFEPADNLSCCKGFFEFLRWVLLLGIYGGACFVILAIFWMRDPDSYWVSKTPKIGRSMQCTLVLTILFFLVHLLFFMGLSCHQSTCCDGAQDEQGRTRNHCMEFLETAVDTMEFSPMLCILFLSARLRASLLEESGQPQAWAQDAMILATLSIVGQLVMVFFRVCLPSVKAENCCVSCCWASLEILRFLVMFGTFGGAGIVIVALVIMTPESVTGVESSWLLPGLMDDIDDVVHGLHGT